MLRGKKPPKIDETELNKATRAAFRAQTHTEWSPSKGISPLGKGLASEDPLPYVSNNVIKTQLKANRRPKELKKSIQDANPILKQYNLFINDSKKRILIIQYPNREVGAEYRGAHGQKPLELRMKPKTGVVEIDIPMEIHVNYDKEKGIEYGEAMRDSRVLQQGGSYGLTGGLGVGSKSSAKDTRRAPMPEGPSKEKLLDNFEDANNKGHVMNKITLGGRIVPFQDGDPIYMYATFKGGEQHRLNSYNESLLANRYTDICTFTKIDAMVQLRPQFDHVDALRDREKSNPRADHGAEETAADEPEEREARAVNMAVKSAENLEELDLYGGMSTTNKLLKDIRDEPWQRLQWIDQDEPESYQVYDENLVYQDRDNAPQLVSKMTNEQYLDAISCPRIDPIKQGAKILGGDNVYSTTETEGNDGERSEVDLGETTDEDEAAHSGDEETATDNDEEWEYWPAGAVRPDRIDVQIRMEGACRKLVALGNNDASIARNEAKIRQGFASNPTRRAQCSFLWKDDPHHIYYKFRLAQNRAGKGIPESKDREHMV